MAATGQPQLSPAGKVIGPTCLLCGFEHLPSDQRHYRRVGEGLYVCRADYVQFCKDTRADGRRCLPRQDFGTRLAGDAFTGEYTAPREDPT
ncbi:MAG TPA: hypothetical protein VI316_09650 [Candidatus Dormibacteraeota bacterium]